MKITVYHNQNTIDPAAIYSDEDFAEVIESLEAEYKKEFLKEFPHAEIDFVNFYFILFHRHKKSATP